MAPTGVYSRVSNYLRGIDDKAPELTMTPFAAAIFSISYTVLYVFPFYLSRATRPSPNLSRDAPSVIRARIRFVTFAVTASAFASAYVLHGHAHYSIPETFRILGWYPISLPEISRSVLLTGILFMGPLFEKGIAESGWKEWLRGRSLYETLSSWIGWRNFVAGPITEELTFRSLMVSLHLLARLSPAQIVFLTPLYFGIAHIHHFYEFTLTHPHTLLVPALLRSLIQFGYTTIFGWYATFVFLRTGSLYAVIIAHTYCNWTGLPRVWGRVEGDAIIGPVGKERKERGKKDEDPVQVAGGHIGVQWTVAYYVLLVAGIVGFYKGLWPLTESSRALVNF